MRLLRRLPGHRAFTLIEVLVVIAIIAIVIALVLPAVQSAREAARRMQCQNNFRQMGLAMHSYHEIWQSFPASYLSRNALPPSGPTTNPDLGPGWAWGTLILPYLEQKPLYDAANFDLGFGEVSGPLLGLFENNTVRRNTVSTFLCPSGGGGDGLLDLGGATIATAHGQYIASAGWIDSSRSPLTGTGVLYPNSRVAVSSILDGTSTTLMLGERSRNVADAAWPGSFGSYADPAPLCTKRTYPFQSCVGLMFLLMGRTGPSTDVISGAVATADTPNHQGPDGFASLHPSGCQFLLCDGSARFVKDTLSPKVFQALATRAGGEILGADQY